MPLPNRPSHADDDAVARLAEAQREIELLRQAVDARDAFLASAAHDLRTPIGTLLLHVEGLRHLAHNEGVTVIAERLDKLHTQMLRFSRRATTLLDISMLVAGKLRLRSERVDVAALIEDVVALVDVDAERAGSQLTISALSRPVGLFDRTRLEQIVLNLLSNAIKYGAGRAIDIRLNEGDGNMRISVIDHGIGIEPEDQARIFERFERGIDTEGSPRAGFGVGLWIVRQIVDAMNGSISVTSRLGEGSSFTVALPLQRDGIEKP